ncbi:hypothetical protein ACJ41O_014288 [Fusarium nematophilum]
MASIHRTTLLRVSPLVSRTAAVWYCFDQWLFFGNFLHRDVRNKTNDFLPAYWNAQMYKEHIRAIVYDGNAVDSQTKWIKVHLTRTFAVDIPGWVCFGLAVLRSVRAL